MAAFGGLKLSLFIVLLKFINKHLNNLKATDYKLGCNFLHPEISSVFASMEMLPTNQ